MWGMSQPGTVGKSSLREILCVSVCLSLGKGWLLKKRGSLVFLDSKKELILVIYIHKLSKEQMAALEKFWVLFLFCFFFSLKGGPADENKLWNDLCLCNWLDCVMLRPWNRNSRAARQGLYLGGVFLGKSGERKQQQHKEKARRGRCVPLLLTKQNHQWPTSEMKTITGTGNISHASSSCHIQERRF